MRDPPPPRPHCATARKHQIAAGQPVQLRLFLVRSEDSKAWWDPVGSGPRKLLNDGKVRDKTHHNTDRHGRHSQACGHRELANLASQDTVATAKGTIVFMATSIIKKPFQSSLAPESSPQGPWR